MSQDFAEYKFSEISVKNEGVAVLHQGFWQNAARDLDKYISRYSTAEAINHQIFINCMNKKGKKYEKSL